MVGNPEGKAIIVDVETYSGQPTHPKKEHVWGWVREIGARYGKEKPQITYSGDWFWKGYLGNPDITELLDEGYNVTIWSTPDSGYVEGPGGGWGLYQSVPASEWGYGFGNMQMRPKGILQFSAEVQTGGVPTLIDANAFVGTAAQLRSLAHPAATTKPPRPTKPTQPSGGLRAEIQKMPVTGLYGLNPWAEKVTRYMIQEFGPFPWIDGHRDPDGTEHETRDAVDFGLTTNYQPPGKEQVAKGWEMVEWMLENRTAIGLVGVFWQGWRWGYLQFGGSWNREVQTWGTGIVWGPGAAFDPFHTRHPHAMFRNPL